MYKVILIPGNGGATMDDHWFPYVIKRFREEGLETIATSFPDSYLARKEYWLPYIKDQLKPDKNTVLIGHSSGAEAAMRFTEHNQVLGSVLVSPCYTDMGIREEKISGWYDDPWMWDDIKKNQQFILQFSSTDDYIVPIDEQYYVRDRLKTEYYEFKDRGHFVAIREFPEIVEAVLNKLKR